MKQVLPPAHDAIPAPLPPAIVAAPASPGAPRITGPSSLYGAGLWDVAVRLSRWLPAPLLAGVMSALATLYRRVCPARRAVVEQNLLPLCNNDPASARRASRELFRQFAIKLVDLWRYEAGRPVTDLWQDGSGWEHFEAAQARGRGVLLVTIHLGNWEFGAPLLTRRGVRIQVITQAEPDQRLTNLRQAARARWGVETLPLGDDPFAAVEVMRRLEANQAVALLMDRPPPATATRVHLFGRPFDASKAAAELARATGCAILPVLLPRTRHGYVVRTLPEIPYNRPALRDPEARRELTQRILAAFEPALQEHASQWYHFVPIWPASPDSSHD